MNIDLLYIAVLTGCVAYDLQQSLRMYLRESLLSNFRMVHECHTQMHRFRVICSRYSDFCEEMARLLAAMQQRGYPRRQLEFRKKLRKNVHYDCGLTFILNNEAQKSDTATSRQIYMEFLRPCIPKFCVCWVRLLVYVA